jgi:tetratricopeptide (TPR) repeat protein
VSPPRTQPPLLGIAVLVPSGRGLHPCALEALAAVARKVPVRVVGSDGGPLPAPLEQVPAYASSLAGLMRAAAGAGPERYLLVLEAGEVPHLRNVRTLERFLSHVRTAVLLAGGEEGAGQERVRCRLFLTQAMAAVEEARPPVLTLLEQDPSLEMPVAEGIGVRRMQTVRQVAESPWLHVVSLLRRGLAQEARAAAALLPQGQDPLAWALRGEAAFWLGRVEEAEECWRSALLRAVHPFAPPALWSRVGLGRLYEMEGDLPSAVRQYGQALDSAPAYGPALHRLLAAAYRLGQDWPETMAARAAVRPAAWRDLARGLDAVIAPYLQLETLRERSPSPWRDLMLARAALRTGDLSLARRSLREVAGAVPETLWVYEAWLTELVSGDGAQARQRALAWSGLSRAGRAALLLAGRLAGEPVDRPFLDPYERQRVGEWLCRIAADLADMGQMRPARALVDLTQEVAGALGARRARRLVEAGRVRWRHGRATRVALGSRRHSHTA